MPTISVIVPVYNVEPYLRRCIDSILAQTFADFELILVDDGSPDGSGAICDEYAERDSRVRVIHKENGGAGSARNVGIDWAFANSDSEWICFIDSDDYIHGQFFELLFCAAIETSTEVSMCGYKDTNGNLFDDSLEKVPAQKRTPEDLWCERQMNCTVPWAKIYRKSGFKDVRYPPGGVICEDEFTTYKVLFKYDSIAFVDLPMYAYFQEENSVMRSKWTPQFLVGADALEEQISYFKTNGFDRAYKQQIYSLFSNMQRHIIKIRSLNGQYKKELAAVEMHYRRALRKYRKEVPMRENKDKYIFIYPLLNYLYLLKRSLVQAGVIGTVKKVAKFILRRGHENRISGTKS